MKSNTHSSPHSTFRSVLQVYTRVLNSTFRRKDLKPGVSCSQQAHPTALFILQNVSVDYPIPQKNGPGSVMRKFSNLHQLTSTLEQK